jgi:EmrB/QacA subfamily drug resistance transporter
MASWYGSVVVDMAFSSAAGGRHAAPAPRLYSRLLARNPARPHNLMMPSDLTLSRPVPRLRLTFAGLMLAMAIAALDQNIVNTALPRVVSDLGGLAHLSWIVTAFMLTSTATTPLYGKLSDMHGRRALFGVSIIVFLIGSALCGLAQSMTGLILFRAVQGLGAGGLMTLAQATIGDLVSPRERGRYQGLFTSVFAVSSVAGPLIGGLLTTELSWRWVFYVNLPIGAAALALIMAGLPPRTTTRYHRLDYEGAVLLTGASTATLLLLSRGGTAMPWLSAPSLGLAGLALLLLVLFILQEERAAEPIIGLHLFRNRIAATCIFMSGMMSFGMFGALVFAPLYFQLVMGMSPTQAGLMLLPQIGMMMIVSIVSGRLVSRSGRVRPYVVAGVGLEALGLAAVAVFSWLDAPPAAFLLALAALGCGMGMGMPNVTTCLQNAAAARDMGAAISTQVFLRAIGSALGVAVSGAVMTKRLHGLLEARMPGLNIAALLERGITEIASLEPAQRLLLDDAYRRAIATSMLVSSLAMLTAFFLVMTLPAQILRGRAAAGAD